MLTGPTLAVTFNSGLIDQFYIQDITGLVGAPIRAPIDDISYGDGADWHNFWKGARHLSIEGLFLVQSAPFCSPAQVAAWNVMEEALRAALDEISEDESATATLVWTPLGLPERTLIVRNDVPLECQPDQNYLVRTFTFGLVAAVPAWVTSP